MDVKKEFVKAIVFDMDGTLLDTLQDLTKAVNMALSKYDLPEKNSGRGLQGGRQWCQKPNEGCGA